MSSFIYDLLAVLILKPENLSFYTNSKCSSLDYQDFVSKILSDGFSDRVKRIDKLESAHMDMLVFGFVVNPSQIFRLVDKGPAPSESPEAAELFRSFWGPSRSQLRKFPNTNIIECVVWDSDEIMRDRTLVFKSILNHLLKLYFNINEDQIMLHGLELYHVTELLSLPASPHDGSSLLLAIFTKLKSFLTSIESTLKIHSITPLSASLRGTIYFDFPRSQDLMKYFESDKLPPPIPVFTILLSLESSTRWPKEPKAFLALSTAYLCNLAIGLQASNPNIVTSLSTNGTGPTFLDVFIEGFIFRCYLDVGFAFPHLANRPFIPNNKVTLLPADDSPLSSNARILVSSWSERVDQTFNLDKKSWISKCNEYSFLLFSEALSHDMLVRNAIFKAHPTPILDGVKLLALWVNYKKFGFYCPIEMMEKLIVLANDRTDNDNSKDQDSSQWHFSLHTDHYDRSNFLSNIRNHPPTSPICALVNSFHLIANHTFDEFCTQFGHPTPQFIFELIREMASDSLLILTKLLRSSTDLLQPFFILKNVFKENRSFDFGINFDFEKLMISLRSSVSSFLKPLKPTQEDILSSFLLPGFDPLFFICSFIKNEFSHYPNLYIFSPLSISLYDDKEQEAKSHLLGFSLKGPYDHDAIRGQFLARLTELFGPCFS